MKLRKVSCLLIILCNFGSIGGQQFLRPSDKSLDSLFQVLQKNPKSSINQEKFFDKFPHTFKEFWETYGYKGKVDNPMYSLSDSHIDSFQN